MEDIQKQPLTLENLHEMVLGQNEKIASLIAENSTLKGALLKGSAEVKALAVPKDAVSIDGKQYQFQLAHFTLPGDAEKGIEPLYVKSEEAAVDEEILQRILSIKGQGILKEIV